MDEELVKLARDRVRQRFGTAMATKATAEFCVAFWRIDRGMAAVVGMTSRIGLENVGGSESVDVETPTSVVLEFKSVRGEDVPAKEKELARAAALESIPEGASQLRASRIHKARDQFFRQVADVRSEIERAARNFHRPGPESSLSPQLPADIAELCWLNASVRTWTDPRSLAEVADDPNVNRVDLPRRLSPEGVMIGDVSGVPEFRDRTGLTGKGVRIAVIDSEIAKKHPAFQDRVIPQQNYSREPWGSPDGHATAVAGVIAAKSSDLIGVAPEATLYNYKAFTTNRFFSGDDFDGALALQRALEDGAQIANCSWGAGPAGNGSSRLAGACDTAWGLGMIVVKSAGNEGPAPKSLTSPADANGIIVVGATDLTGRVVQDYSSRGPTEDGRHRPHIVAIGGSKTANIVSCLVAGGFGMCGFGTSLAAPYVTGLLALLLERNPSSTPDELRSKLEALGMKLGNLAEDVQGAGLVSTKRLS